MVRENIIDPAEFVKDPTSQRGVSPNREVHEGQLVRRMALEGSSVNPRFAQWGL